MTKHSSFILLFKALKILIAVTGLILLLGAASNRFVTRSIISDIYRDFYAYTEDNPVDILILGTSHSQCGINTLKLSKSLDASVYNLAMPAQGIGQTYYTLKDALKHCKPKIAVIGLYFADQPDILKDREYFAYEQLSVMDSWNVKGEYLTDLVPYRNWFDALFPVINEHQNWKEPQVMERNFYYDLGASTEKNKHYNGYVPGASVMTPETLKTIAGLDTIPLAPLPVASKRYIQGIVDHCRSQGVEPVFVQVPLLPQYLEKVGYKRRSQGLTAALGSMDALWLDWNTETLGLSPEYFRDESSAIGNNHLNSQGANVYTDRLGEALKERFGPLVRSCTGSPMIEPMQIQNFFRSLKADDLVFLTVNDDASYGWLPHELEQLKRLNLKKVPVGIPGQAYAAVFTGNGSVLWEKSQPVGINRTFAKGEWLGSLKMPVGATLTSSPGAHGEGQVILNGREYSLNVRGLNCVVYSLLEQRVVGVDCFDLYDRSLYLEDLIAR